MKDVERAQDLLGTSVFDRNGERIGTVGNVYVDDATEQPEWVTVRMGLLGTKEAFVPLEGASAERERLDVGVSRSRVRDAPRIAAEHGHLSEQEGRDLYHYYGVQSDQREPEG